MPFGIVSERAAESRWAEAFRFVLAPLSMHDTGFSARSATAEDDGSDDDGEGDGDSCNSDHAEGRGRGRGRERGSSASVPEGGEASDEVTMTLPGGLWDAVRVSWLRVCRRPAPEMKRETPSKLRRPCNEQRVLCLLVRNKQSLQELAVVRGGVFSFIRHYSLEHFATDSSRLFQAIRRKSQWAISSTD